MPGKVLIVDDTATNRIVLKVKLSSAYYEVLQATSGAEALDMLRARPPDIVLIAARLPDMDAAGFCAALRAMPDQASLPVVVIANRNDRADRIAQLRAGANEVLSKPLDDLFLLARLRSLLRARDTADELRLRDGTNRALGFAEDSQVFDSAARVAIVTAEVSEALRWKQELAKLTSHDVLAVSLKDAMRDLSRKPWPDVVILGMDSTASDDALHLLADIRAHAETRNAAALAVVTGGYRGLAADALDIGANDLMPDGFDAEELALRLSAQVQRKRMTDRLRDNLRDGLLAAVIDPLTGLYNRRYAMPHLARMATQADKMGRKYAVMLADLDHFKQVNDTFGHAAGDAVLVAVAKLLRDNLRAVDLVARVGGEEFLIAMPDTDSDEARAAARRLCRVIAHSPIALPQSAEQIHMTVSIGVAMGAVETRDPAPTVNALLDTADQALYFAKSHGRNQVMLSARPAA